MSELKNIEELIFSENKLNELPSSLADLSELAEVLKPIDFWTKFPTREVQYVGLVSLCVVERDSEVIFSHEHDELRWLDSKEVVTIFTGHTGLESNMVECDWGEVRKLVEEFYTLID